MFIDIESTTEVLEGWCFTNKDARKEYVLLSECHDLITVGERDSEAHFYVEDIPKLILALTAAKAYLENK